jgi:hypothetical protein
LTTSPFTKFVPFTVKVRLESPQEGTELVDVVDADSEVMVGATIGNAVAADAPPPPPVVGLNTVTCADPTLRMSEAGTAAVSSCVVLRNVVGRLPPFHCTTEHGRKFPPVTLSVMAAVPAVALPGKIAAIVGTGSAAGAVTEKLNEFEIAEPLLTVTGDVPWNAASADVSSAVSCVALTKVVPRGDPFQLTTDPFTKFVPVTVSVRPVSVQDAVDDPVTDVMAGAEIVNALPPDVPPPGVGFTTST